MKKLRLDLDQLVVTSFSTDIPSGRGTVRGHSVVGTTDVATTCAPEPNTRDAAMCGHLSMHVDCPEDPGTRYC